MTTPVQDEFVAVLLVRILACDFTAALQQIIYLGLFDMGAQL